jgi:O-antigen/teichoic acid export membrane protein
MLAYLRRIGKNSVFYLLAQVLSTAVSFLLIPIYTRVLTPRDYGVIALVDSASGILGILFQLGLVGAVGRIYFDHRHDRKELDSYVGTVVRFLMPWSLAAALFVGLFGRPLLQPLLGDVPFRPYVWLALGIAVGEVFLALCQTLNNVREQAARFMSLAVAAFLCNVILILTFVVGLRQGALGNAVARFFASMFLLGVSLWLMRDHLGGRFDRSKLEVSLKFGLPLVPHSLSGWIIGSVDRLFLNHYAGLGELGVYALGFKVGNLMNLVTVAINYAWAPFFLQTAQDQGENAKPLFARLTTYYVAVLFFLGLLLSLPARELLAVVAPAAYGEAHRVVPIVAFGWVFSGLYYLVVNQIFLMKQTKFLPVATFSAGLVQILLNAVLTPRFGMIGSAWAMFLAQLCSFSFTWILSQHVYPMRFELARIGGAALVTIVLLAAAQAVPNGPIAVGLLWKCGLLGLYPLILLGAGFFTHAEIARARAILGGAAGRVRATRP